MMKRCTKCGELKELSEFNKQTATKDGHRYNCRKCANEASRQYMYDVYGKRPMSKNKKCPVYLGVAVAERLVRHLFKDVLRMPYGNIGFDFICAKNKKIDVKSSCIRMHNNNNKKYPSWNFHIAKNKIADFFLLIAFNSIDDLEPLHQWLIPGHVLNHLTGAGISLSTIHKWDAYRQPIDNAQICCNTMMVVQEHVKTGACE